MKGSVEYLITFMLIMAGFLLAFNFYGLYYQNHQAHAYRDQISNLIENYDGDMVAVERALDLESLCNSCEYKSSSKDGFVQIEVKYYLRIPVLNINRTITIKGLSYLPTKSS